jgi:uncharacterized membrane protein YeaQ/YmgE (transglycosylase-associated protein family)
VSSKRRRDLATREKQIRKIREREECMYFLAWIVIGAVVGWGAGRVFQGNGYGRLMDILMGIGGAVVGGLLTSSAGYGGIVLNALVAMVGAALLTVLAAYVNGRRVYARRLSGSRRDGMFNAGHQ